MCQIRQNPRPGDRILISLPVEPQLLKRRPYGLIKLGNTFRLDLVGRPEECLGARAGRRQMRRAGSLALGPSSVVPLREHRVSKSECYNLVHWTLATWPDGWSP
jgi:hypothetical protein